MGTNGLRSYLNNSNFEKTVERVQNAQYKFQQLRYPIHESEEANMLITSNFVFKDTSQPFRMDNSFGYSTTNSIGNNDKNHLLNKIDNYLMKKKRTSTLPSSDNVSFLSVKDLWTDQSVAKQLFDRSNQLNSQSIRNSTQ